MNTAQEEIAKFDQLANDWWNPQGSFKTLHDINPLRLHYIQQHAELNKKAVIDVGCGGGILAESMAKQGANVIGIDLASASLEIARQHAKQNQLNIKYVETDIELYAKEKSEKFDVVTCMELLEHVPDPAAIIKACATLTKPKGKLFFSTLNRNLKSYVFAILSAEYLLKIIPKGTHDYQKFIRPAEFAACARAADLQVAEFMGIAYNPFTQDYRLTANIDINYLIYCTK